MKSAYFDYGRCLTTPNDGKPAYRALRHRGTVQRMLWIGGWWFCLRNRKSAQAVKAAQKKRINNA